MPDRVRWTREQLLAVLLHYTKVTFGSLDKGNAKIREIARLIGRTPDAVAMKAVQFASLDPFHRERGVGGLQNTSQADRALYAEFRSNPEEIAAPAGAAYAHFAGRESFAEEPEPVELQFTVPSGPTEVERIVRVRRVQSFFRGAVLAAYRFRCAISGLSVPELLNASHVIPWNANVARRADPGNGIALNAFYDRAFDRGLITFDEEFRVVLSLRLRREMKTGESADDSPEGKSRKRKAESRPDELSRNDGEPQRLDDLKYWFAIEGRPLELPAKFGLDPAALAWHRENVFLGRE